MMAIDEQLQREQAIAIKSLVITNTRLQKIDDELGRKIDELHTYNMTMGEKQHVTNILEGELRRIRKIGNA